MPNNDVCDLVVFLDRVNIMTITRHWTCDVSYHWTCEDQFRCPETAEVCFLDSHSGCSSPSCAKFNPELNQLLNVAFAGLFSIICFQLVINAAAHLLMQLKMFDRITTAVQDQLQWLRIGEHTN